MKWPSMEHLFIYMHSDTPRPALLPTHTHTLDEKIVGYTYTSGSYFSNMSCQTYRIYNLDQDL